MVKKQPIEGEGTEASLSALQFLIRVLSRNGVSYPMLAESVQSSPKWTNSALKAFVNRPPEASANEKILKLAEEVQLQVLQNPSVANSNEAKEALKKVEVLTKQDGVQEKLLSEALTKEIGRKFQHIRNSGSHDYWPEHLAFVRPDWAGENLIILMIQIRSSNKGHSFVMKIEGRRSNRRVIIGDILKCEGNTYFSGLAYNVVLPMKTEDFFDLEAFDLEVLSRISHPSVIGLECFSILQSEVTAAFAPVNFHGLDGAGIPICGVGLVITPQNFSRFGIDQTKFTAVVPMGENTELTAVMNDFGARTIAPMHYARQR